MALKTRIASGNRLYGLTEMYCTECGANAPLDEEVKHQTLCSANTHTDALCSCTKYSEPHPPHRPRAYKNEKECEAAKQDYLVYNGMGA